MKVLFDPFGHEETYALVINDLDDSSQPSLEFTGCEENDTANFDQLPVARCDVGVTHLDYLCGEVSDTRVWWLWSAQLTVKCGLLWWVYLDVDFLTSWEHLELARLLSRNVCAGNSDPTSEPSQALPNPRRVFPPSPLSREILFFLNSTQNTKVKTKLKRLAFDDMKNLWVKKDRFQTSGHFRV